MYHRICCTGWLKKAKVTNTHTALKLSLNKTERTREIYKIKETKERNAPRTYLDNLISFGRFKSINQRIP